MQGDFGVAISTTGDPHRMEFLLTAVRNWRAALEQGAPLFVTVDGDETAALRVADAVGDLGVVLRVGQPGPEWDNGFGVRDGRIGVAANKNTGIEALVKEVRVGLFLSDDDTSPLGPAALALHTRTPDKHTMVCWGLRRLDTRKARDGFAYWNWPRGVVLYVPKRATVNAGGFREEFGPGGHEHVEFSRRVDPGVSLFASPPEYAERKGQGAGRYWHAEDRPRDGERLAELGVRRAQHTSVRRTEGDWGRIAGVMKSSTSGFVPYSARENNRAEATVVNGVI